MHAGAETLTDSMKMFRMGVEGGKPAELPGVQPEWFYKGNGTQAVAPGAALVSPSFARDGGEEPEIAGIYLIGPDGVPRRLGFALANEFSDHVTERVNYLFLAHSVAAPGVLRAGDPARRSAPGTCAHQPDPARWSGDLGKAVPLRRGEHEPQHPNLEHHHKYALFREPGEVHVHMLGTATLSFADGIETREGDVRDHRRRLRPAAAQRAADRGAGARPGAGALIVLQGCRRIRS